MLGVPPSVSEWPNGSAMSENPIFIIGTERSGSNLVRLILNSHSQVFVPHPPHVLHFLAEKERDYGDLGDERNFEALACDVGGLVRRHIHPWDMDIDPQRILRSAPSRNLVGLFLALYDEALRQSGKVRWGCKSTFVLHHVRPILDMRPATKFILIVRDPRDVALSSRTSVFNPFHPFFTAELWNRQQEEALGLLAELPSSSIHCLRYESLLDDPASETRELCEFLGETFEATMLDYAQTPEAIYTAGLSKSWKNAGRPILSGNQGRFRDELSDREIAWVEAVAGETMDGFGYSTTVRTGEMPRTPISPIRRAWFRALDVILRFRVEWKSLLGDRNHWLRWRRRAWVNLLWIRRRGCSARGVNR